MSSCNVSCYSLGRYNNQLDSLSNWPWKTNMTPNRKLFVILVIVVVYAYLYLCIFHLYVKFENPRILLVLKLPRSGSSWLTAQLNNLPSVYVSKEIIQRSDCTNQNLESRQSHLKKSLISPTDKYRYRNSVWPSGRFWEDYLTHSTLKWLYKTSVLGVTVNPEYIKGTIWREVLESSESVSVLVFYRKNIVKTIISDITGKYIKIHCGGANIRTKESQCLPPQRWDLNISTFFILLDRWENRYRDFATYTIENFPANQWHVVGVTYEDLQVDLCKSLQIILTFGFWKYPIHEYCREITSRSTWKKRGSDDLSLFISNYEELVSFLASKSQCKILVPLFAERDPMDTTSSSYDTLNIKFLDEIRWCINEYKAEIKDD